MMIYWSLMGRGAWTTGRDLMGGLALGIAAGATLDAVAGPVWWPLRRTLSALLALGVVLAAGMVWGRHMGRLGHGTDPRRVGSAAALLLGPTVILTGLALAAVEAPLVSRAGRSGIPIHIVFMFLFAVATLLVAGIGSFALGLGMRDRRLGVRLALAAGPVGAAAFLAVAALLDMLGWRVGAPHAAERATMLVVTFVSAAAAALVAGGLLGQMLPRRA